METNKDQTNNNKKNAVDDRGTDQAGGHQLLKKLRDQGFEANDKKFAVALGRPVEEVVAWISGKGIVDDDIVMKARGIAKERNISLE